jgi:hypothetical protein
LDFVPEQDHEEDDADDAGGEDGGDPVGGDDCGETVDYGDTVNCGGITENPGSHQLR